MDTVTQALLGAVVGQAAFGRRLGGKAVLYGAVGGVIPDLDAVIAAPFGEFASMVHHRGVTHALWFGPVLGSAIGTAMWRRRRRNPQAERERLIDWVGLWTLALVTHPLLDLFTSYGTQLLTPFSSHRFAVDAIGIIDPVYSLLLLAALVAGFAARRRPAIGKRAAWAALGLSTAYLLAGLLLNTRAERMASEQLRAEGIRVERLRAFPTLLQLSLRRVVATSDDAIRVGYVAMLAPSRIEWFVTPRERHPLIERLAVTDRGQLFTWFAQELVAGRVQPGDGGTLVELSDLRYGLPPQDEQGFWGIRATFDERGELTRPVERFRRSIATRRALGDLWDAARGHDPCTYRVGIVSGAAPPTC